MRGKQHNSEKKTKIQVFFFLKEKLDNMENNAILKGYYTQKEIPSLCYWIQ